MHRNDHQQHWQKQHWQIDRVAVAWAIQLAVVGWIALGAAGRCNFDQGWLACRTSQGDLVRVFPAQ